MELPVFFVKVIFLFVLYGGTGSWYAAASGFSSGDRVRITSDEALIRRLHSHGIGFPDSMRRTLGETGTVRYVDSDGDLKVAIGGTTWFYSPLAVTKLDPDYEEQLEMTTWSYPSTTTEKMVHGIKVGDVVLVHPDKEKVRTMQSGHGGWNEDMAGSIGKLGKVTLIDGDNDAKVRVCGRTWYFNPESLTKFGTAGEGLGNISGEECKGAPEIAITKKRVRKIGQLVDLDCSVTDNPFSTSYVRWVKEGVELSRNGELKISDPRIMVVSDESSSTFTLQIDDIQGDDAGIYTCEHRHTDDSLFSSAKVELVVKNPPSILDNSTSVLTVREGEHTQLECYADGHPKPNVTWHRVFRESFPPLNDLIYRGGILEIPIVREVDGGVYYCVADNGAGRSVRRDARLEVLTSGVKPVIDLASDEVSAVTPTPSLSDQLQHFTEEIANSTSEIRSKFVEVSDRLKSLEKGLLVPDACADAPAQ